LNLMEAISISELMAGGPGSGPTAPCPQCGHHGSTGIHEGDIVRIQKPLTVWNQKTGNNDTYPVGKRVTVINILPKIGTASQMIAVQAHKNHDPEYMKMEDVKLHKSIGKTIEPEPVPKSQVIQKFTSNDGSSMTYVKTPQTREYDPRTLKDLANQTSRYKGKFDQVEKVDGADGNITRLYDTSKVPSDAWGREGAPTAAPRPGVTLWVHRYSDHVTIQEQSYLRWGQKASGIISWTYKNIGMAFGMLKKRYGISIPLSRERF